MLDITKYLNFYNSTKADGDYFYERKTNLRKSKGQFFFFGPGTKRHYNKTKCLNFKESDFKRQNIKSEIQKQPKLRHFILFG